MPPLQGNKKVLQSIAESSTFLFWNLLQHRAQIGAGDQPCVPCQPAGLDVRLGLDVGGLAGGKLVVADGQVDGRIRNVDLDGVPFPDQTDGAAGGCLGADVADGRAAGRPEKRPSVMSATVVSSFMPASALVGLSISRIPGPPLGPS